MIVVKTLLVVALLSIAMAPSPGMAVNCKKGIPCGNSCISASKTCRIGPPAEAPAGAGAGTAAAPASGNNSWVGSVSDRVFFRAGCSAARDLAPANSRFFATDAAAIAAGFRRSAVPGC